nr:receptor-type tyrosine-protein phosphatase beta-like [Salvelinus alpinus]
MKCCVVLPCTTPLTDETQVHPQSEAYRYQKTSDSLGVSWQPGPGRTERFRLLLTDRVGVVRNLTLESTAKDYTVTDLVPGRVYNITMVTEAWGRQSTTSRQIQTVPYAVSNLKLENNNTQDI